MGKSISQRISSGYRPFHSSYRPYNNRLYRPSYSRVRSDSEEAELQLNHELRAEDLKGTALRQALLELDLWNTVYRKCPTWDPVISGWVEWDIPQRIFKNGRKQAVGPNSYNDVEGFKPPICPCSTNSFRTLDDCAMQHYRTDVNGKDKWVFSTRQHQCPFIVMIPPVRKRQPITYVQGANDSSDTESDIISSQKSTGRVTRFTSHLKPTILCNFDDMEEVMRHVDVVYSVPYHPAADSDHPAIELSEFDYCFKPPRADDFCESMIGRALIEWNSIIGIPPDAWATVRTAQKYCVDCERTRTFDGDAAHRNNHGVCAFRGKGKARAE
ncbi:hypothetical protein HWV62_9603 [Athelia sp. TMB]|nr:hypothetical protein HWV62_9603 [Athelia sp. TMB]